MCGIFASIVQNVAQATSSKEIVKHGSAVLEPLQRRGPDYQQLLSVTINDVWSLDLYSTVLHMRGDLCPQPTVHNKTGDILLWNGEIFGGVQISDESNDGEVLLNLLVSAESDEALLQVFRQIQGPYAFLYYQRQKQALWFGRDVFGRRSLTYSLDSETRQLTMSSVVLPQLEGDWKELNAAGVYRADFQSQSYSLSCYPWYHNSMLPNDDLCVQLCSLEMHLDGYESLNTSICGESLEDPTISPSTAPATATPSTATPSTATPSTATPSTATPSTDPLDAATYSTDPLDAATPSTDPLDAAISQLGVEADQLIEKLQAAVYRRVGQHSYYCDACHSLQTCSDAHVSVMFSGGIDSVMLAYLADKCVPRHQPIDLLNVAFEVGTASNYDVPDRLTGRQALYELPQNRRWNFVEINVTKLELQEWRVKRTTQLIRPLESVLDDSIGCALWFASRGHGVITNHAAGDTEYKSKARVVLSGLGADEQLGGYSRHRSSYQNRGLAGLLEELDMDVKRLSSRNLGRDDRIVSDHGKEARFPYLDEEFVSFLNKLPVHKKMDLSLPRGVGEKLILRVCAVKCNLPLTARLAKRAIQFGSRIAKCENRKEKGSDVCSRLSVRT